MRINRIFPKYPNTGHLELTFDMWIGQGLASNFGLGGVGVIGTQTHLTPKFIFSSDLGLFVLKMLENAKIYTF